MKTNKKFNKSIVLAVLLGMVTCGNSVWAGSASNGTVTIVKNGSSTLVGGVYPTGNNPATSSDLGSDGIGLKSGNWYSAVTKIQTGTGDSASSLEGIVYGICVQNTDSVSATSIAGGIDVKSSGKSAYGISLTGNDANLSGLGNVTVETTSESKNSKDAYGIYFKNGNGVCIKDEDPKLSVSFAEAGGTINVYSKKGENFGIAFANDSTGTSQVVNIKTITAGITKDEEGTEIISEGSAKGIQAQAGVNSVEFIDADSSVTAKSQGNHAYGIFLGDSKNSATGIITITGLGNVMAETTSESKNSKDAYGIYFKNGNSVLTKDGDLKLSVSFVEAGGTINVYSKKGENYGITFSNSSVGTSQVTNVKKITAGISKNVEGTEIISEGSAKGIQAQAGVNSVKFTEADSSILSKSQGNHAYGIVFGDSNNSATGTTTVIGLGNVMAETTSVGNSRDAYGIYFKNGNSVLTKDGDPKLSVSFAEAGGTINAYSKKGENYGITFSNSSVGTSQVTNVKKITAGISKNAEGTEIITDGPSKGIQAQAGDNTIKFTGADSSILSKSQGNHAYGIVFGDSNNSATGTTTVIGLGNVTAETTSTTNNSRDAYGIYFKNGNGVCTKDGDPKLSVSFAEAGGTINAYSKKGENYGITFSNSSIGTSQVTNVKKITAGISKDAEGTEIIAEGPAKGIQAQAGDNTIDFIGADSIIIAKSKNKYAYGIYVGGNITTVSGLKGITVVGNSTSAKIALDGGTLKLNNSNIAETTGINTLSVIGSTELNLNNSTVAGGVSVDEDNTLTVNIKNGGTWNLSSGEVLGTINVDVDSSSTLTSSIENLTGTITNGGTFNACGSLNKNIAGNGTTKISNSVIANDSTARTIVGVFDLNGGTLDMQGSNTLNSITIGTIAGSGKLKIDVDMSSLTSDKITVGAVIDTPVVTLASINIVKDYDFDNGIELPKTENNKIVYVEGAGKDSITYDTSSLGSVVTNDYKYTFVAGSTKGTLNYKVEAVDITFEKFVKGVLGSNTLSLTADLINGADEGDIAQGLTTPITINLNGHTLTSTNLNSIVVGIGKTFNLDGGSSTTGTTDANTKFVVEDGGSLNISGFLKMNGSVTGEGAITNTGTLDITADNLKVNATNINGTVNLGTGEFADGLTITAGQVNIVGTVDVRGDMTGKITVENTGVANFYWNDYNKVEQLSGSGTINIKGGTINDETFAAKVKTGTKLTLLSNGTYRTAAGNVFSEGDTTKTNSGAVISSATDKFNFVGGILEITDQSYTLDYLTSALKSLHSLEYGGTNSITTIKMCGAPVGADDKEKEFSTEEAAAIGEQVELPKATAKAEEGKTNTLVGSVTDEKVEVDGVEFLDKLSEGFNIHKLDLAEGSTGLVITNDKKVVLGGNNLNTNNNLISVGGDDTKEVNAIVGVKENEQVEGTTSTKGTLGIGVPGSTTAEGYKFNGSITANEDSKIEVNANAEVTKGVALHQALLETAENVTFKMNNLDLDDSSMVVGENSKVETKTLNAGSTQENGNLSSILGEVLVTDTMSVTGSELTNSSVTVTVGNEDGKGVLSVNNIVLGELVDDKWVKGAIFGDPAWKIDGVNKIEDASNIATATTVLDGSYIAGRNSVITFGTMDSQKAIDTFNASQLTWGPNGVTAAVYINQNVDLGTYGDIMVDGSRETSPGVQPDGVVNLAANSLLMVDGSICMESSNAAIKNIAAVTVDSATAKLYISGAIKDEVYYILAGKEDVTGMRNDLWSKNNIIFNDILETDMDETKVEKNIYRVKVKAKEETPAYFAKTVAPDIFDVMRKADSSTPAYKFMATICVPTISEGDKIAVLNKTANMPEELGVYHNHFTVTNMTEDAVGQHLALENKQPGRDVWAVGFHSKETVEGLGLKNQGNNFSTQYNGAIVGLDFMNSDKATLGAAITYVTGKATALYGSHNDSKYYGVTLYGRAMLNKNTGVHYDVSYTNSSNELQLGSGFGTLITGDQKLNSFSMGARIEKKLVAGATSFTPYAGARWLSIRGQSFKNNLGMEYNPDQANMLVVPVGLKFKAGMENSGWKMSFLADGGYQWNLGTNEYKQNVSFNDGRNGFDVNFADKGNWYAGFGFEFSRKNFTATVGSKYMTGSHSNQHRWYAQMNWNF